MDFEGHAVLINLDSGVQRIVSFPQVHIGADCGIMNKMDIEEGVAVLELSTSARLFTLDGVVGEIELPGRYSGTPALDGDYVYYMDGDDDSIRRVHRTTRVSETLVTNVTLSYGGPFLVEQGMAAWGNPYDSEVSVFNTISRTLVMDRERIPDPNATFSLVGLEAGRLTLLQYGSAVNGTHLVTFDPATNGITQLATLPEHLEYAARRGRVVQDKDRVAYVSNGLHILNLTTNVTTDYAHEVTGWNLGLEGSLIAYNEYDANRQWGLFEWLGVGLIAVVVAAVVARHLMRRRRPSTPP